MTDKRYTVFISSTFEDLKEQRRAVQDAILAAGDFPVQMESFPATDDEQFAFIKTLIDKCDYYILVIAGRYGSIDPEDGMSYTEKEFHYAISRGIPVLVMVRENLAGLALEKSEQTPEGRQKLAAFIQKAQTKRVRKLWNSDGDLKHAVRDALDHAKATKPGVGWVRGDTVAAEKVLQELVEARRENDRYRAAIGDLEAILSLPPLPDAASSVSVRLYKSISYGPDTYAATVESTWAGIFPFFQAALDWDRFDDSNGDFWYDIDVARSIIQIGSALAEEVAPEGRDGEFAINSVMFKRLLDYYVETGLMNAPREHEHPLTPHGKRAARRHNIAAEQAKAVSLVDGVVAYNAADMDDEIPF